MVIFLFWITHLGFLKIIVLVMQMRTSLMFPPLDMCFECWFEHVTFRLLYVIFRFSTGVFYKGVPGFANDCPRDIWCSGLTTCCILVHSFTIQFKMIVGLYVWHNGQQFFHCFRLCFIYILMPHSMIILYFCQPCFHVLDSALFFT